MSLGGNTRTARRDRVASVQRRATIAAALALALAGPALALASLALAGTAAAGTSAPSSSVSLGVVTKRSGCHAHGPLPDHACTPGARFINATKTLICTPGYARRVRHVTYAEKSTVYAEYGLHRHFNGTNGEVDHLVSLELGGSNDESNLWPEAAAKPYGSHEKDRLENALHHQVCAGSLTLAHAQQLIASNWVRAYHSRFG